MTEQTPVSGDNREFVDEGARRKVSSGIPATVDPAADLAARTPNSNPTWNDSIYITNWLQADGHTYGVLVHTIEFPNLQRRMVAVSVSDETTGWYKNYDTEVAKEDYSWSKTELNIKTPDLSWTGNTRQMSVKATTPWGSLDFQLKAEGPDLKYAGTGSFPLVGDTLHEFAFPSMQATGTLTIEGKTHKVAGTSWMDRQFGPVPITDKSLRWSWMNLRMPNGDKVAVWNAMNSQVENSWATAMHPDGSYKLAAVKPFANGAHKFWTSPASGQKYPTRWTVEIPTLKTSLEVSITGAEAQEIIGTLIGPRYEGTATFTGKYKGELVSGKNYVEMFGNWQV